MPIYEWLCPHCGYKLELLQWSSTEKVMCPKCQTEMAKQLSLFDFKMAQNG